MSTRRAAGAVLVVLAATLALPATNANAQDELPTARLTLAQQTPWNTPEDPALQVTVRAENLGAEPLTDLALGIAIGTPVRTRSLYEASLTDGPSVVLFGDTRAQEGELPTGESGTFSFAVDLSAVDLSPDESLIYPMRVDLLSGGVSTGTQLRTPVLWIVREPEQPLATAWTFEMSAPPSFGADGSLQDPALIDAVAEGGVLRAQVNALTVLTDGLHPARVNLVVAPRLLEELADMADGFVGPTGEVAESEGAAADAASVLGSLREVVRADGVETTALPYAAASAAALEAAGLDEDFDAQTSLGRSVVTEVLGVPPGPVARYAGTLDQVTLDSLAGATVVLADAGALVLPVDPLGLAPPPTGTARTSGGLDLPIVLPDPGVEALLASGLPGSDPVLGAQAILGELAAIWQEAPGTPGRGAALSTAGVDLPAAFWEPLARRVAAAPFLRNVTASDLAEQLPGGDPAALAAGSPPTFSRSYTQNLHEERRRVEALASMLVEPSEEPDRLTRAIYAAESAVYLGNEEAGRRFIDDVHSITEETFAATVPGGPQVFTLTSSSGTIPVLFGDPGDRPLHVIVELSSSQLRFPNGSTREVTLERAEQDVTFEVQPASAGQITVEVLVRAPSGRVVGETRLLVRSTAYSRIALIITGAAALGLVVLWARRLLRRRTR